MQAGKKDGVPIVTSIYPSVRKTGQPTGGPSKHKSSGRDHNHHILGGSNKQEDPRTILRVFVNPSTRDQVPGQIASETISARDADQKIIV